MATLLPNQQKPYDPEKFGSGNRLKPGRYHVFISKAEEPEVPDSPKAQAIVEYTALAGTTPGMVGMTIDDRYFPNNPKTVDRLFHLFFITSVKSQQEINKGGDFPMSALLGKQLLIEVSMSKEYTNEAGKTFPPREQVGWRPEPVTCMVNGWEKVPRCEKALKGDLGVDAPIPPTGGGKHESNDDVFNFGEG